MKTISQGLVLCFILMAINLLYAVFIGIESDIFIGTFDFNAPYVPGLLFGLLIFPVANFFLWKVRKQIGWVDYTLIVVPLLLWLLVIPGGSFTNFLFINFPLIWTVSFLYLLRFSGIIKSTKVHLVTLFFWILITIVSIGINQFIPILPE